MSTNSCPLARANRAAARPTMPRSRVIVANASAMRALSQVRLEVAARRACLVLYLCNASQENHLSQVRLEVAARTAYLVVIVETEKCHRSMRFWL